MIAAGTESMSMIPMLGPPRAQRATCSRATRTSASPTAWASPPRRSPTQWKVSREAQDAFALASHQKALAAQAARRVRRRDQRRITVVETLAGPRRRRDRRRARRSSRATKARAPTRAPKAWRSCGRCSRRRDRHGRQQLADVRRRRRVDPRVRARAEGARPRAARALGRLRGRRRAARDHGHRPDRGDSEGARKRPASRRTSSTGSS